MFAYFILSSGPSVFCAILLKLYGASPYNFGVYVDHCARKMFIELQANF